MTAGAPTLGGIRRFTTVEVNNLTAAGTVAITGASTLSGALTIADALNITDIGSIAAAGNSQGTATAIASTVSNVTAADGTKGVILPTATAGAVYFVYNSVATNGLPVYPATSDTINGGSANAAVTIEGKTLAIFIAMDATNWAAIYTANT